MIGVGSHVVVVGPGRVGTVLGVALAERGATVAAAGGGEAARRRFAARVRGARTSARPADLVPQSDLVIVATPDDAVEGVVTELAVTDAFRERQRVVHVAGSRGLAALRRAAISGARTAACHPAQTFPDPNAEPVVLRGVAWAITAGPEDRGWAHELVRDLGGQPYDLAEADRLLYHAGLVVGANAAGAAVSVARQLLRAAGLATPADLLAPLVAASVANVLEHGASAITGPVRRGDAGTVRAHLGALQEDAPALADAYRALGLVVLGQVRPVLPREQVGALEAALAERAVGR